jgi:uncharacterized protein (TIRG00374 family)
MDMADRTPPDRAHAVHTRRGIVRYLPTLLILGLAVYVLLPRLTNLTDSVAVIERLHAWALALAVIAQALSYWGSGYLMRALAGLAGERLSVMRGTLITLGAASMGLVAGGLVGNAAATYRWSRAAKLGPEAALLAGWLPTVFNSAALVLLSVLGLAQLLAMRELSGLQAAGFAVMLTLLLIVAGGAWWALRHRTRATASLVRVAGWWRRVRHRPFDAAATATEVAQLLEAVDALRGRGWHAPVAGALANMVFDALTLYFLFVAAGHPMGMGVLLAGYGLPLLLGRLSFFLPGGVGVIEATMTALYRGLGVPTAVTVLVILAYRTLSFWIPTLLGFPVALYLDAAAVSRRGRRGHQRHGGRRPSGEARRGVRRAPDRPAPPSGVD